MAMIATDERNRLIKMIHAASRERNISKDQRKLAQKRLVGQESCANMTENQLRIVANWIRNQPVPTVAKQRPKAKHAHHRQIYALWWDLGKKGGLGKGWKSLSADARRKMLNGFIKKIVRGEHVEWIRPEEAVKVIEALKVRIERLKNEAKL